MSEQYGVDRVTVTVEWTQQANITYTATVSPGPVVPLLSIGDTSRQLTILCNTTYNFSVVAATRAPCRPNASNFTILNYGEV